jgi:hypothetical protein
MITQVEQVKTPEGETIRVGDSVVMPSGSVFKVVGIFDSSFEPLLVVSNGNYLASAHLHQIKMLPQTLERLEEMILDIPNCTDLMKAVFPEFPPCGSTPCSECVRQFGLRIIEVARREKS